MSEDVKIPGGTSAMEPGFAAVLGKYGPDMLAHFRNAERLAEVHCRAANGDDGMVEDVKADARRFLHRIKADRDFALSTAEAVARWVPREEWPAVPSVSQLRRDWGFEK